MALCSPEERKIRDHVTDAHSYFKERQKDGRAGRLQTTSGDGFISFTAFESICILPRAEEQFSSKLLKS